jgi:hypothetical protein
MAKLGKKYLDKSGLSYLWKRIDGRYVHIEDGKTSFADGEIIVGIDGEKGVKGSGVTIGGEKLSETPTAKIVATEKAVAAKYDEIIGKIADLGSVMSFLGVTETNVAPTKDKDGTIKYNTNPTITLTDKTQVTASNGDVVIFNTKTNEPEEFIWTQTSETEGVWQEIGKVFNDEAITSVTSGSNAIVVDPTTGTPTDGNVTVSLKIDDSVHTAGTEDWAPADEGYGHIHLSQDTDKGLKAEYGREVLTIGDAMNGDEIEQAISNASSISWNGSAWVNGFEDYQA